MIEILTSFINLIPITVSQSLIVSFVVVGVMLPLRILNFPDLTSEGAYPLGGCVCGVLLLSGVDPVLAVTVAVLCGCLAGCATAFIHLRFGINTLLAGILVMTMLYSINLRILGRSNVALFGKASIFDLIGIGQGVDIAGRIVLVGGVAALALAALIHMFRTEAGVAMRAVGSGPEMAEAQGIDIAKYTLVGVGAASGFSALGGAVMVQTQGFADVNMGFGVLISGLAALMIGEAVVGRETILRQLLAPFIGALIYYQLVSLCLSVGLEPSDLKLATGGFVLLMLALPRLKSAPKGITVRETVRE